MKASLILLTFLTTLLLPSAVAIKGVKQSRKSSNNQRGLHADAAKKRKIIQGTNSRSCTYKQADGTTNHGRGLKANSGRSAGEKGGDNKQEVKFTCESRSINNGATPIARGIFLDPAEIRDKINYKVKTDKKGIRVKVEYKTEYEENYGMDDYTDTKTSFEVLFDSIVEYVKVDDPYNTGGNNEARSVDEQAYDWKNDFIVQALSLGEWGNFTNVTDSDDGVLSYFSVESLDEVVEFNFSISRAPFGEKLTANTMKIDVRILNFPWLRDDTNLALMSTVKSEMKVEMSYKEQAYVAAQQQFAAARDANGNLIEQEKRRVSKWTENVQVSFDQATEDVGFVPFGDYTWDDHAEATQTNASTTMADLFSALCTSSLLEYAQQMDPDATMPPGCENATLPPKEDLYIVEEKTQIRVVGTSPPIEWFGNFSHQHIAYSFVGASAQGAAELYWDPEAGIGYSEVEPESESGAGSSIAVFSCWVLTMVSGVLLMAI